MERFFQSREEGNGDNVEAFYSPERTEKITRKTVEAGNFDELYDIIRETNLITTSQGIETAESLIAKIETAREVFLRFAGKELPLKVLLNDITRTYGIRPAVGRLLESGK